MNKLLRITSSLLGEDSVSTALMAELVEGLNAREISATGRPIEITERNFPRQQIPHLDQHWLQALMLAPADRSDEQQAKVDFSDQLVEELREADTVVISLPMYNFSVPSMLKAWVDHIARAGVTFKYTDKGSVGLLKNKKAYLVATMGSVHQSGETDFLRPYMKQIMSFIGIDEVEFITADGLNMGPEVRQQGLTAAKQQIAALTELNANPEEKAA